MTRKVTTILAVVVGLPVLLFVLVAMAIPSGSVQTADDGTQTLEIAMLRVPVASSEPIVEGPDQFAGVLHPDPEFDTSDLGPDMTFHQERGDLPQLDPDEVLRAVYLGDDVNDDPYYIWHSGSPDLRQMIGQFFADFGAFGRLETSYGTEATGGGFLDRELDERLAEMGMTTGSIRSSPEGTSSRFEWHALPRMVAAVALYEDGEPVGWQRPVSGTVAFQFVDRGVTNSQDVVRDAEMVALTAEGDEWNRYVAFPGG